VVALAALATVGQAIGWDHYQWGGKAHHPKMFEMLDRMAHLAREEGATIVVGDWQSFGDNLNLLRIYAGLDRVMVEAAWHPPNLPIKGDFIYFTPRPLVGIEPMERVVGDGHWVYRLDQWPPTAPRQETSGSVGPNTLN
jgi:hypothetical protein